MTKTVNLGNGFVQIDDYVIEKKTLDVIERIRNYDDNLDVLYLNPDRMDMFDAPWVVIEKCADGSTRKVFDVWEMNESVFERLVQADTRRIDVLANIDKFNTQIRLDNQRRYDEKRNESSDKFAHLLANPKTTYTLPIGDSILTVDDAVGVTKRTTKD